MNRFLKPAFLIFFALITILAQGQNAKRYHKTGLDFIKAGSYVDAIDQFSRAIDLDPKNATHYIQRAIAYEREGNKKMSAEDYDRAIIFTKEKQQGELYYNSGRLYYDLGDYEKARQQLEKATLLNKKHLQSFQVLARTLIKLAQFEAANKAISTAIKLDKRSAENFYYQGLIHEGLQDYVNAEASFAKALSARRNYLDALLSMAKTKITLNKTGDADATIRQALAIDPRNKTALYLRSTLSVKRLEYLNAINDISTILAVSPEDEEMYFVRGLYYQEFKQHQNAINDFNKVLALNPSNAEAYYRRGWSHEETQNFAAAMKDYESLASLAEHNIQAGRLLENARKRLFELSREQRPPEIFILEPNQKDKYALELPLQKNEITIRGKVKDESPIKFVKVNGAEVPFNMENEMAVFTATIQTINSESINVSAVDVYDNVQSVDYTIFRTEINPPQVFLIAPYASDNNEVYLSSNDPRLYVEGRIQDESLMKSIFIEGATASYKVNDLNPQFSATIDILNKNRFTVRATDAYGNETVKTFSINRESLAFAEDSPMGKTWVVFIENSNYRTFASLDGPASDVTLMKSALANYKIHNLIHKKDMTKEDLEKFFSIELRDLTRSNQVNSVMIWYAGHGKFINDTGYWIPIDARRDDEFTYYNINALRASMQTYPKTLTHTLVITDACESGPTFYQAMRASPQEKSCDDWTATRFRSSQVLSSAGYEMAADRSQFTRTFANSLLNNTTSCIPIDKIVNQVTIAVEQTGLQRPKFGKISGLEDEGGTFFFVSKE